MERNFDEHILTYGKGKNKRQWKFNSSQFLLFCSTYFNTEIGETKPTILIYERYRPNGLLSPSHRRALVKLTLDNIIWQDEDKRPKNMPKLPCKIHFNAIPEELLIDGRTSDGISQNLREFLKNYYQAEMISCDFTTFYECEMEEWYKTSSGKLKKR